MSHIQTTDEHTLACKALAVTREDLIKAFEASFTQACNISQDYKTTFHINMVKKKGVPTGRFFIWVQNPKVYKMLLGLNPDGSKREKIYADPNWKPGMKAEKAPEIPGQRRRWTDIMDDDEEEEAPIIKEKLTNLITVPTITLTASQKVEYVKIVNQLKQDPETDLSKLPEHPEEVTEITVRIEPALAHNVENGFCHNVLRSSALHSTMNEEFIFNEFKMFNSSNKTYPLRFAKGKDGLKQIPFPYVKIVELNGSRGKERIAYITFDSSTRDASFAFHMKRCCEYKNKDTNEVYIVNYTYARSRDS